MAYTTINKSSEHFNTKLYTGNGSNGHAITGVGFQPDWVWLKNRSAGTSHVVVDAVRGNNKVLSSNNTEPESPTSANKDFRSFDSDGFTVDTNEQYGSTNTNGANIVAWNWKAGNSAGSSNTDGSINTTYTSVNTTAGFSISKYTGNGTGGATIGHGLGSVLHMYIVKRLDAGSSNWHVYHQGIGATKGLRLNLTNAENTTDIWQDTAPTSSVFSLGSSVDVNASGGTYIAYCFAEKTGYSKFGSYVGTNSGADGPFIYTGFKPAFILIKNTTSSADWHIRDNKRDTYNASTHFLKPNSSDAEVTSGEAIDILSNGFKIKANGLKVQDSGNTYIYMAFAAAPLVGTNNVPCTAR
jgi:hypothetical protein